MSEFTIETRRRSRSKTPFLRSTCDHEACEHAGEEGHQHHTHHNKKKAAASNVHTIIEEVVEVTSSSSPSAKQNQAKTQQKTKTSDYSSEDNSPENKTNKKTSLLTEVQQQQQQRQYGTTSTTTTSSSTTVITKSRKAAGLLGIGSAATSTPKSRSFLDSFAAQFSTSGTESSRRLKEVTQNELNSAHERSQREAAVAAEVAAAANNSSKNRSYSRIFGTSYATAAGDLSDHIAYQEYKRAGEYWKTTPKTDYTYSELSPHRRVLAPGIVAMPNMSRRSLENHYERINYMIERDPAQEAYIRRRYDASKYTQNRLASEKLTYDSGDEMDYNYDLCTKQQYYKLGKHAQHDESWFMRIITTIITTFSSAWTALMHVGEAGGGGGGAYGAYDSSLYRTKLTHEKRGFFGSIGHGLATVVGGFFRYIYLGISSILYADTWLLQSRNAENRSKKRFLILLLLLLPLLLLGAWWLLDEQERLYYLQRSQALLPASLLASLRGTMHSSGATLKELLQVPSNWWSGGVWNSQQQHSTHLHMQHIQQNMQKALTPEEYENILNHVNSYVQQLVDLKLQQQQKGQLEREQQQAQRITPEQTLLIVRIMRENLERIAREKREASGGGELKLAALSEQDLQRLAALVQLQLEASGGWATGRQPVQLSAENVAEIKRLITEHVELHSHAHYTLLVEKIDLDALLARLLSAPQLARFVDARIGVAIDGQRWSQQRAEAGSGFAADEAQQLRINELNSEIAFIKLALSDKLSENEDLHYSIGKLKVTQDDLLKRMQEHELATDKRFSALLAEIEAKLATLREDQFTLLNQQVKLSLVEILGFKQTAGGAQLQDIDLQNWVRNMFVAKDYLELRLLQLNNSTNDKIRAEIDRSGSLLMRDISERLKREILAAVELQQRESTTLIKGQISAALSEQQVQKIVKSVLAIYDADKTGLVDFALESAGGQILSTRCTENFQTKSAQLSVFGIPLWYPTNTPRVAISPNVQPGECWAFQGFPGFLVLKLNSLVYVTGFTLEHIPKTLTPNGRIDSAPRNFTVWGLEHEKDYEPVLFGKYEYVDNDAALQYFPVQNVSIKRPYEIVELRIESNHGHPQYTCLYRFRVHGKPPPAA